MSSAAPSLLTKPQVAKLLGISIRTLDGLMISKSISYIKLGRSVRFEPAAVEALLNAYRKEAVA